MKTKLFSSVMIAFFSLFAFANSLNAQCLSSPFTESFDSGTQPSCVTISATSGGPWDFNGILWNTSGCSNAPTDHTGNGGDFASMDHSSGDVGVIMSFDSINVSATSNPYLEFYFFMCTTGYTPANPLIVETFDGTTWNTVDSIVTGNASWMKFGYDLTTSVFGTNLLSVRFRSESGGSSFDYFGDHAIDDVSVIQLPYCFAPTSLTTANLTATSVDLDWVENNSATTWQLSYGPAGYTVGSANITTYTSKPATLTGLSSQTAYDWYVRSICGAGDTSAWSSSNFTTLCGTYAAPFIEDFTTFVPNCWEEAASGTIAAGPSTLGSGNWGGNSGAVRINLYTTGYEEWIISPDLDFGAGGYQLAIDASVYAFSGGGAIAMGSDDSVHVVLSADGGTTWQSIYSWNAANAPGVTPNTYTVDLTTLNGTNYKLGLYADDGTTNDPEDYYFEIDNFELRLPPACPAPSLQLSSNISYTGATLAWTENGTATNWIVEYGAAGFSLGSGTSMMTTSNPLAITGLSANTNYDWYVRALCGPGDTSAWTGPASFYTGYCIPNPSSTDGDGIVNVAYDTVNHAGPVSGGTEPGYGDYSAWVGNMAQGTSVTVNITYATGYTYDTEIWIDWNDDLDFDDTLENVYSGVSLSANPTTLAATFMIPLSAPLGQHKMRIGGADAGPVDPCYSGSYGSLEDYTVNITAPPSCFAPSALTNNVISPDSASIGWTENNGSTNWQIEYGPAGFTQGTGTMMLTSTNPHLLTGLSANTNYDWYVRTICGPADTSAWSTTGTFKTLIQTPQPVNCTTGVVSQLISEEFDVQGGWTGDIGTSNRLWRYNTGGTGSPGTGPSAAHSGTGYVYAEASTGGSGLLDIDLISPAIDLSAANSRAELSFWMHGFGGDIGTLSVQVGTSATGPFTPVFTNSGATQSANADPWTNVGVNLDAYVGQVIYLNFNYTFLAGFEGDLGLDLVQVTSCVSCSAPANLASTNVVADSATLSWTQSGSPASWEIEYGASGFSLGSGSMVSTTSNPHLLTGLMSNTSYDWYVRAICGPGDTSGWAGPNSFTTLCSIYSAPYFDDVEAHTPTTNLTSSNCWTATANNTGNDWNIDGSGSTPSSGTGPLGAYSGNNYFYFEASGGTAGNEAYLTSPLIDISGTTNPRVTFFYHMYGASQGVMADLFIEAYNGTNFVVLDSIIGQQQVNQADPWLKAAVPLAGIAGITQVRFTAKWNGAQYGDISLDDITVESTPNCLASTPIASAALSSDSAVVSFTNPSNASLFEISYGPLGTAPGTGSSLLTSNTQDTLTGLMPATTYDWYVRGICAPGDTSAWSTMGSFNTLCPPALIAPLTETFDGNSTPNCWTQSAVQDGPWVFGAPGFTWNTQGCSFVPTDHTGNGGSYAAMDFSGTGVIDVALEMPPVDVTALNNPYIEFYFAMCGIGYSPINILYVDAWDGTNWNIVDSIQENTNGWKLYGFNLSNHVYNTNFVRVRLRASSAGNTVTMYLGDQAIDDLSIKEAPADNLAATALIRPAGGCGSSATDSVEITITNVGAAAQSNFNVGYSVNGSAITPEVFTGTIAPGASANYTFNTPINLGTVGNYDIVAYTLLTGDFDNTNDTVRGSVLSLSNISNFPYAESFESGAGGWLASGNQNSTWALGTPANTIINSASNGTQAWVTNLTGDYNDGEVGFVNSPCFDFTNVANPYIELDIWYDIETSWDGAVLQSSIDGGNSWQHVGALNDPNNWYNDGTIDAFVGVLSPDDGWSGNGTAGSQGWVTAENFLAGLGGLSNVRLRMAFVSDGAVVEEGMAFDNVHIYDSIAPDPYYPIGIINTEDASGVADSLNVVCWTSGTVVGIDLDGNNGLSFTIVDMSTGSQEGINVFNFNDVSNYVVTEGDSIRIHGPVIQFRGLTELNVDSIEIISTGNSLPSPIATSTLGEATESKLLSLSTNFILLDPSGTGSYNMDATNGTDTITIRVDADTDVNDSLNVAGKALVPGDTICGMIGVGGQFNPSTSAPFLDGYQIFPMRYSDVTICRNTTGIEDNKQTASSFSLYPNPSEGAFILTSSGFNNDRVTLTIRDLGGRIVKEETILNGTRSVRMDIDLNNAAKGIYFLSIQDGDKQIIEKLIVQ